MAVQVSKALVFHNQFDLSGDITSLNMDISQEPIDNTTVDPANTTRIFTPGLINAAITAEGYMNMGDHELELNDSTDADNVISVYPNAGTAGLVGYGMKGARSQLVHRGEIGNMYRFTYDLYATSGPIVRLNSMEGKVTKTSTGDGSAIVLGAVTAARSVYCFLHVTAIAGTNTPSLTVKLQSSADGSTGWADVVSMTAKTAVGAEVKSTAGAMTDTHWRITWTISGTNPSFTFMAGAGIV